MSINPLSESRYRYRLAMEYLERAEKLFSLEDWVGTVSASQLAIENLAKTIIAIFEIPTWSHDPSAQLDNIIGKLPSDIVEDAKKLANLAMEIAPEHGRTTYGEPNTGLIPSDIYKREHALNALENARKAKEITKRILSKLNIKL